MHKHIVAALFLALIGVSSAVAGYVHVERFDVWAVAATDRGYTWLVREDARTMQLFGADAPVKGPGILRTESEHGESSTTFRDAGGHTYTVQIIGTCEDYPFSLSAVCES